MKNQDFSLLQTYCENDMKKPKKMSSLDSINEDEDECTLYDTIPSNFNTFEEAVKWSEKEQYQDKVQQYVSRLSRQQVNILNLLIDGYHANEIREKLKISEKRYADELQTMRSYENVKVLF